MKSSTVSLILLIGAVTIMIADLEKPVAAIENVTVADEGPMPELNGAVAWLNSDPLNRDAVRGKVVLVNFWTYSCINSLRELPYVRSWAKKYKDAGLVVIGVHAPEFGFEKQTANVENAARKLKINFPVPIDSDHAIWKAFNNDAWPADYFVDAKGRIRYRHVGEGDYEKSERMIQGLLRENGTREIPADTVGSIGVGAEAPPGDDVRSPETYLGYARTESFASPQRVTQDAPKIYTVPTRLSLNEWALSGPWTFGAESAVLNDAGGKIAFRFHCRDVHMVLAPPKSGKPARFRVKLDGRAPGDDGGVDCDADGAGEVREPRMYQLIREKGAAKDRTFEIEFLDPGVLGFSFTFG